jgi:putative spermidine/putrescine transport system permease protein
MPRTLTTFLLLAPALLMTALLFVYPLVGMFRLSVTDDGGWTLAHFRAVAESNLVAIVFRRTFMLAATVTAISVVLGYLVAYFMVGLTPRIRAYLTYVILMPFWVSVLVRTFTWIIVLGREGIVNSGALKLGLISEPVQLLYTNFAVHLGMVQILLPIVILTCMSSMLDIDPGLVKAARVMGASPVQAFRKVFFPLSLSGAATGGIICFILCLGFYVTPALLGGRTSVMIANLIDLQVHRLLNWNLAAALGATLLALTLLCLGLFRLLTYRRPEFAGIGVK